MLTLATAELETGLLVTELLTLAFFTLVAWTAAGWRNRYAPELLVVGTLVDGLIRTVQTGGVTGPGPTVFLSRWCWLACWRAGRPIWFSARAWWWRSWLDLGRLRFERDLQSAVAGVLRQARRQRPARDAQAVSAG